MILFIGLANGQSVTTNAATSVSYTSAQLNASASSLDPTKTYRVVFKYSLKSGEYGEEDFIESSTFTGGTTKDFSVNFTSLASDSTYYCQAVLIKKVSFYSWSEISTGSEISFTTLSSTTPTVTIADVSNITNNSATFSGNNATNDGGSAITDKGLVYATTTAPTLANSVLSSGASGTGTYNISLTSLSQLTRYYVRAYATNSIGTAYSATEREFVTKATINGSLDSMKSLTYGQLTIYYSGGTGDGSIIYMRANDNVINNPANGSTYSANASFGNGSNLGNNTYVVFVGASKGSVTVTNLDVSNNYFVKLSDYKGSGASTFYDISNEDETTENGSALSVELIKFEASVVDKKALLYWQTASELNNNYFVVEKSVDGRNFFETEKVLGAGNSNEINIYNSIDNQYNGTISYYRLKQVDFDGKLSYSGIVSTDPNYSSLKLQNVSSSDSWVNLSFESNEPETNVKIYDINGNLVFSQILNGFGGQALAIPAASFAKGVYLLEISNLTKTITKKFVY